MGIFSKKSKADEPAAHSAATPAPEQPDSAPAHNLVVNRLVQHAIGSWGTAKNAQTMYGVLRQCVIGDLLIDASDSIIADKATPFRQGDTLAVGTQVDNAGKRLLVAFTDNDRLAMYRQKGGSTTPPVSLGQPASATLQMAATSYDGIAIDPGSPDTLFIAYADEIRRGLTDDAGLNAALKTAVIEGRSSAELIELAEAAPVLFVGVSTQKDDNGEVRGITVPSVRSPDGGSYHPAFTSPAEVWAWAADLDARPTALVNIVRSAREDGQAGIAFDPAGAPAVVPIADVAGRY